MLISSDYQDAIQNPSYCFADLELKNGQPCLDKLGLPLPITGGFASVYQIVTGSKKYAVRCFSHEYADQQSRYAEIHKFLDSTSSPYLIDFDYQTQGILVKGKWFPILKMQWLEGLLLNRYIASILNDKDALQRLADDWITLIKSLKSIGIAHGDLQHGNILVCNGKIKLIDYDGMFVPALAGQGSHETGHPSYQHPKRSDKDFNAEIDRFAALAIYTAILAVRYKPTLWKKFDNGDNILFTRKDFANPHQSEIFAILCGISDMEIVRRATALYHACNDSVDKVPDIDITTLQGQAPFPSKQAATSINKPSSAPTNQYLPPFPLKQATTSTNKSSPAPTNQYVSPKPLKPQSSAPSSSYTPSSSYPTLLKWQKSWGTPKFFLYTILVGFLLLTFSAVMMRITSPSVTKQNPTTTNNNQKSQEIELQAIEARTGELVNLLVGNVPMSAILDEIRKRNPVTVQIEAITQTSVPATAQDPATTTLSLTGYTTNYNELNDFLLLLKTSPLLDDKNTVLRSSTLQPATSDKNLTFVGFQIETKTTTKKPVDILPELQKIGADGLVTRINLLWQQGIIYPVNVARSKSNIPQNIEEANQRNKFALSLLPDVDNIDYLIRDIQEQIPKTITLRTFQPTAPVKGTQYDTYSFTIDFDGKFEDILNAIQKIERLKPLLVIKDLTLTNQKVRPTLMSADFTLQVFVPKN